MNARTLDNTRLRQWRHDAGLTAEKAAVLAGISYPYLRALESGQRTPSLGVLAALANVYGKPPGDLIRVPLAEPEAAAS